MIAPSRPPLRAPGLAAILCLLALSSQAQGAGSARPAPAPPPEAASAKSYGLLARGPFPERGLPFFGPNAIPVLRGEYLIGAESADAAWALGRAAPAGSAAAQAAEGAPIPATVWYTRESVVLSSAWAGIPGSANASLRALSRPEGRVLYVRGEGYSLFIEAGEAGAGERSFALALNRRFAVFFIGAPSDAELSFPAVVEY